MNKEDTTPPPQKKKFTFDRNAKGVRELLSMKFDVMDFDGSWYNAFGTPERRGVWIIWGNSGSGKTSFALQLCKYLCRFGRLPHHAGCHPPNRDDGSKQEVPADRQREYG